MKPIISEHFNQLWFAVEDYKSCNIKTTTYWCLVGNGWEWGNGMIITSDYGSFPHSLLSTSKTISGILRVIQKRDT
jgi:Gpi18-like mannosyltransferase